VWEHKPGRHNLVSDAISRKMLDLVAAMMTSLFRVETDFTSNILEHSKDDAVSQWLRQQVLDDTVR